MRADQTVTVTATNADISEDLDLKTVATLFGQAKDLEQFEQMLNNPDSAFSNLDLNGDGNVDYLRVIETADQNRHLIVIQAVLAKDIYQDVASIFVEKDPESESVTVQVIGDEYIYGADYIIEPVYIYRPVIYDWFWGPSWVCWHSPFYWDYWPTWWHPYHCIAHHLYWDHIYWHHHYYPICTYRTGHHHHPHYAPMRDRVSRSDYATRHPERSFASRNASRNYSNARSFDRNRQTAVRSASDSRVGTDSRGAATRVSNRSTATASRTFGSSNVRSSADNAATRGTATRNTSVSRGTSSSRSNAVSTTTRSTSNRSSAVATPSRSASTAPRSSATRSTAPSVNRSSSSSSTMRSSSNAGTRSSSSSAVRSSGSSSMRSSGGSYSSGGSSMRSSGGGSSSRGGGGTRR
ncbi:MAG: hypothetical protein J6C57_06620 [Paludibacteraceae bacterium]|nr:hypothetical protein [Paludibacteraceae bacterium]MBP3575933.1 hypothetical protein [Paludibacteraceae bacterium]